MGIQFLPRPHYALELKKRRLHPENASNVFRPHYAWSIWKRNRVINAGQFWISAWLKLGLRNVMIIATSSFSNSVAFKTFSVHTKIQSRLFKFLRFEERFWKASFSWLCSVHGAKENPTVFTYQMNNIWRSEWTNSASRCRWTHSNVSWSKKKIAKLIWCNSDWLQH